MHSNDIQQLVRDRMKELDLSYRQAAAKSNGLVSHGTLNAIATGRHSFRISASTVDGIALALDLEPAVIEQAVGRAARASLEVFVLPERASKLSAQERRAIVAMMDALLTAAESGARPALDDAGRSAIDQ